MLSKSPNKEKNLTKYLSQGFYATIYLFNKKRRVQQNDLVVSNPDINLALELWNMLENKFILQVFELSLPSVKINKKIFIPMIDTIITRDNIT